MNKVIAAVSALVDAGNRVIFDKDLDTGVDTSFNVDKATGLSTKMKRERNVWVIDDWYEEEVEDTGLGFGRPESARGDPL